MKKCKRVCTLLLAFVMSLTMMSTGSFAANDNTDLSLVGSEEKAAVEVNKTYTPGDGNKGTITLETYATGEAMKTEQTDTVLVLDTSGSMDETAVVTPAVYDYSKVTGDFSYNKLYDTDYFYLLDGKYYEVNPTKKYNLDTYYRCRAYITVNGEKKYFTKAGKPSVDYDNASVGKGKKATIFSGTLYERKLVKKEVRKDKIDVLKDSVNAFIDNIAAKSDAAGVNHRIALVEFASGSEKLIGFTEVNTTTKAANVTKLKDIIDDLEAGGATYADYGMDTAYSLIKDDTSSALKSAVLFTDGQPTHGSTEADFSDDDEAIGVATKTIAKAKLIKDMGGYVWTIDVLPEETVSMNTYMEYTSSNYPNATTYYAGGTKKADGFHILATNVEEIEKAFDTIAQKSIDLAQFNAFGKDTVIQDKLSKYYKVDGDVKVYYVTEKTDGSKTFNNDKTLLTKADAPDMSVSVDSNNQLIKVTGIDVGSYYVAGLPHKDGKWGRKIIVEIPVVEDGTAFGKVLTNDPEESYVEDEDGNKEPFNSPTAYYPYFELKFSEHPNATKKIRIEDNPDYDVTADIPAGYAYAGILDENNEFIKDECGKELNPAVPTDPAEQTEDPVATYIVKEVSDIYYDTTIRVIGNNSNINNVYGITYTDSTNFKETGIDAYKVDSYTVTDSQTKAGTFIYDQGSKVSNVITSGEMVVSPTEPAVQHFQNRVRTVYNVIKWTRAGGYNYSYDFKDSKGTSLNAYLEAYEWDFDASEDPGYLSASTLSNGLYYFKAYAVTPDGVKVTGKTDYVIEFDSSKGATKGTYGRIKNVAEKCATEIAE